eukprot:COSAG06_NODE_5000_length_3798_cov_10.182752_4_plen_63_part_00
MPVRSMDPRMDPLKRRLSCLSLSQHLPLLRRMQSCEKNLDFEDAEGRCVGPTWPRPVDPQCR